jgi:hypothetical protein
VEALFEVEEKQVWLHGIISKRENHGNAIKCVVGFDGGETRWFTLPQAIEDQQLRLYKPAAARCPRLEAVCPLCAEGCGNILGHEGPHTIKNKREAIQRPTSGPLRPQPTAAPRSAKTATILRVPPTSSPLTPSHRRVRSCGHWVCE